MGKTNLGDISISKTKFLKKNKSNSKSNPRGAGRPALKDEDKKSKTISLTLTENELETIDKKAAITGTPRGIYIRRHLETTDIFKK